MAGSTSNTGSIIQSHLFLTEEQAPPRQPRILVPAVEHLLVLAWTISPPSCHNGDSAAHELENGVAKSPAFDSCTAHPATRLHAHAVHPPKDRGGPLARLSNARPRLFSLRGERTDVVHGRREQWKPTLEVQRRPIMIFQREEWQLGEDPEWR